MGSTVGFFHVGLTVADMDQALGFYRDVLGLEVLSRRKIREEYAWRIWGLVGDSVRSAFLRIPGSEALVELFEFTGCEARPVTGLPCDPGDRSLLRLRRRCGSCDATRRVDGFRVAK